jgi:uncharacterized protein (DUF362 family)/ferredoxin
VRALAAVGMLTAAQGRPVDRFDFGRGTVDVHRAWTTGEVRDAVLRVLRDRADRLPSDKSARIVIKPNLNNDLVALTGNSADLRVLCSLIEGLQGLGYTDLTVADGANVGIERRGIDVFTRLRVAALRDRYGVKLVDLNRAPGRKVKLEAGASPEVAEILLDADFIISVPKVKTHAEAGISCACKNWVGICRGQDKRQMHYDLGRNIARIAGILPPDLVIVDGLVGMEGNGPGDGQPFRLGVLVAADEPWLCDLVVTRLVDFPWRDVPYLKHGAENGKFEAELADRVHQMVPIVRKIERAPPRSPLAILSERRELLWLKKLVRPVVARPSVTELAYKAKIVQDVYAATDDGVTSIRRDASVCEECRRCEDFCPTHLKLADIGVKTKPPDCINCLYCWWACPKGAITLEGPLNAMSRQVERYKRQVEAL